MVLERDKSKRNIIVGLGSIDSSDCHVLKFIKLDDFKT